MALKGRHRRELEGIYLKIRLLGPSDNDYLVEHVRKLFWDSTSRCLFIGHKWNYKLFRRQCKHCATRQSYKRILNG